MIKTEDNLLSVLDELLAIAEQRKDLTERYADTMKRLEVVVLDAIRRRLNANGEGFLALAVTTAAADDRASNADLNERALDVFMSAAPRTTGDKTRAVITAFRLVPAPDANG